MPRQSPRPSRDRPSAESGDQLPDQPPTPYERALETGSLDELHATSINRLIQQAAVDVDRKGVVDELGALRIVLTRLVNEQQDLDALTANVTRVATVALQAARTQRTIGQGTAALIAGALDLILDEIRKDHETRDRHPHPR